MRLTEHERRSVWKGTQLLVLAAPEFCKLNELMVRRKQLLNKCQEEFEKGSAAMEAVEAREKAEEGKSKEQREMDQAEVSQSQSLFVCLFVRVCLSVRLSVSVSVPVEYLCVWLMHLCLTQIHVSH